MIESIFLNDDYRNVISGYSDGFFDFTITDVPYGISVDKMAFLKQKHYVKQKNGDRKFIKKEHSVTDWDSTAPAQDYFNDVRRVSKQQIIFGSEYVQWEGMTTGIIKWNKGVSKGSSFKPYEEAYCSVADNVVNIDYLWSGMMQGKSPSEPMVMQGNKKLNEKRIHPCQKPVILWLIILNKFCKPGMWIIDTHAGSGSLRIACDIFGCNYVGCEINKSYFIKHEKRWNDYISKLKLQF